jgi:hypothetical protein
MRYEPGFYQPDASVQLENSGRNQKPAQTGVENGIEKLYRIPLVELMGLSPKRVKELADRTEPKSIVQPGCLLYYQASIDVPMGAA